MRPKKKKMVYPALVRSEARNLKKFATKGELDNLNFEELDPDSASHCIYGQMCNSCWAPRAIELIEKCCSRVYDYSNAKYNALTEAKLNGTPKGKNRGYYYSPIEIFIAKEGNMENGANERLIKYLKGEVRTL